MSLSQYTNLNLLGHLSLDLANDNSSSGTLNDVPTKDVSFIRFTSNSAVIVTGFNPDYNSENNKLLIVSYTGTNTLTLKHSASGSTAVNRIQCPLATDVVLTTNSSIILIYDSYSNFWRLVSGVGGGGGTSDHALLTNLQGGGEGNYYHSNQPINTTSDVQFNTVTINNRAVYGGTIKPNTSSGVVASIGSVYIQSDGTIWTKVDSGNTDWRNLYTGDLTNESTGFPVDSDGEVNRTSSGISFSNVNRQFSIGPTGENTSYSIVIKGREYVKTTTESITISNTTGSYYIYFNESGTLTYATDFDLEIIYKYVYVASIYWNASQSKVIHFGDERHGCTMDGHTHARIHQKDGAVYVSGSALTGFTIDGNGTSDTHTQFAIGSGQIRDEDILHNLSSKLSTDSIPVLYRLNSGDWNSVTNTNQKFHYASGGRAYWNQNTAGTYSLSEVANNKFCLYHILSSNDKNNPYFSLMGINQYDTKSDAREGALTEISQYAGLPFVEFVFIGTIIFETKDSFSNTGKSIIVSTDTGSNYIDWRFSKTLNPSTASVNIHNNLGGLQGGGNGDYYHSNQPINTTDSPSFNDLTLNSLNVANINYPTSDGTSGQAVVTDGSGNLGFQTFILPSTTFTSTSDFNLGSPIYFNGSNVVLAKADNQSTAVQYVVIEKTSGSSGTYTYTCSKTGEISLTTNQWDLIKESGTGGLTAGLTYYLSPSTSGKIVSWIPALKCPVIKAISSTRAFIDMSINSSESGMGDSFIRESFTGDGTTTTYVLTKPPAGIDYTWVHVGGVYQIPNNAYTLTSGTINFTGVPASGSIITIQYARAMLLADTNSVNKFTCFTETVSGSAKNVFNLPSIPANVTSAIVFVGGMIQDNSKYSITENIITFFDSIDVGTQVIVFILNSSGVATSFDSYVTRKEVNLASSGTTTISSVFVSQISGCYRLFDILDPRVSATIYLKHNGVGVEPDVRVDSNSSLVSITQNTQNDLNIYISSNLVTIQNLLGRTTQLRIYRET
jgi:hypothetical protein